MAIQSSDIKIRLSTSAGSAGNITAQVNPNASLGGYISTTDLVDGVKNNLFSDITGDQNSLGQVDYRCFFIYNSNSSLTWQNAVVWLSGKRTTAASAGSLLTSNAHGFFTGDAVQVTAELVTDALPSSLSATTTYYVINPTTNTFQLALTVGGSAIAVGNSSGFATQQWTNTLIALALDSTAASVVGASSAQSLVVANTTTTPVGLTFTSAVTKSTGISLGNIANGTCIAVWVKRTALNAGPRNVDGMTIGTAGDTLQ